MSEAAPTLPQLAGGPPAALRLSDLAVSHPSGLHDFAWDDGLRCVSTLNAELVLLARRNPEFRAFLGTNLVTVDGQWTLWALRRKYGRATALAKQSGLVLLHDAWAACSRDRRQLLIVGADADTNARAVAALRASTGWDGVSGYSPPFAPYPFPAPVADGIRAVIAERRPKVIVAAMGAPKQEFWARDQVTFLAEHGVSYVLFLGGAVDMLGGRFRRAPPWMRRLGLESPYRLFQDPGRWRRELRKLSFLWLFLTNRL